MEPWVSESRPRTQLMLSMACLGIGLVLAYLCRGFAGFTATNGAAGFFLGILLLVVGVAGVVTTGKQRIVIDPGCRRIIVEDANAFGTKTRAIPFGDILHVGIGSGGKRSNYVNFFYLSLKLRDGEEYPLFAPGRGYEGGSDRETVEGWRMRLEGYLGRQGPGA